MGNSNTSKKKDRNGIHIDDSGQKITTSSRDNLRSNMGMSRTASGADIQEKTLTQFLPIEKLSKILQQKTFAEHNVQGIMEDIFIKYLFAQQQELGKRFFKFLHTNSKAQTVHLGTTAFRQQCEKFLGLLDDTLILESYVKMYSDEKNTDYITIIGLKLLLLTSYNLAMFNYSGGSSRCPMLERTLNAATSSCYFGKDSLTVGYVSHWLEENCPRLIPTIHRYCVHILSTSYRSINHEENNVVEMATLGLELNTPILEKTTPFNEQDPPLLPLSEAWLLAGALPQIYSKPQPIQSPTNSGTNLASQAFIAKMLSFVPSHWTLLYDSRQHGVGANRFLHHVLGYRGPTLVLLKASNGQLFCLASVTEWKETHLYIGNADSRLIQLLPKFNILDKGEKILYLNTSIRGYPKGLRGGNDPKKPIISVDEHFEKVDYRGMSEQLLSIEVWGCGDKTSRDIQLDIKKWQIKEAERQRTVKLTAADWMDHPDRYLLELGGRTNYNNSAN